MKVNIVRIGNSKGVRLPSSVIKQCGFGEQAEMRVDDGVVILAPARKPRQDWAATFEGESSGAGDGLLLPDDLESDFDDEEWTW